MKHKLVNTCFIAILALFVVAGCSKKEVKPVAINEKTDKCEICHMAVKNNEFATEIILESGKSMVFDDIGCMYKWMKENPDKKINHSFVKDYDSKEWIEADEAAYVYDKPIKTPMAYNVLSFTDKKDAQIFIDEHGGSLLTYDNLQNHKWEKNEEMVKEMKEKMNMHGQDDLKMEHSEDSH
ncbi:nitrous oxide reductase accessory protein NosL [Neobacillus sp. OS1-2]|uniref:nitrous oxide reductase accessory protein NosL n=1 Tax=Neobacillus sp. OS1-2 TaxID=3070680 RepID=UPI0027E0A26B|nr:nitrous oxide reductase accessory protein NosL [Neobacillus sp. OS1-2]WML41168.1 nitrous oxide reductase accessory protein NosL [Neobacillus sp. OS1-2]